MNGQETFLSIEDAKSEARKEDKKILLIFSGSDWCKPCIQLKKEILDTPEFETLSDEMVSLHLDFPYKRKNRLSKAHTKHNEKLAEQYNTSGQFPHMVLITPKGDVLKEFSYEKGLTATKLTQVIQKYL